MKKNLIKIIIQFVIAIALAVAITFSRGFKETTVVADKIKYASDGCTIVSFLYLAVGFLGWIATTGFFDIIEYGVKKALNVAFPSMAEDASGKFIDYKTAKAEKQDGKKTHFSTLIVGAVLLIAAGILTVIWYKYQ